MSLIAHRASVRRFFRDPCHFPMVLYVAFIAILNLALGYALAVYLGGVQGGAASTRAAANETSYSDDCESDQYESDDSYEDFAEEEEFEPAVS
jgi:hypothetical protein